MSAVIPSPEKKGVEVITINLGFVSELLHLPVQILLLPLQRQPLSIFLRRSTQERCREGIRFKDRANVHHPFNLLCNSWMLQHSQGTISAAIKDPSAYFSLALVCLRVYSTWPLLGSRAFIFLLPCSCSNSRTPVMASQELVWPLNSTACESPKAVPYLSQRRMQIGHKHGLINSMHTNHLFQRNGMPQRHMETGKVLRGMVCGWLVVERIENINQPPSKVRWKQNRANSFGCFC